MSEVDGEASVAIAADAPYFAGHFPANPVVPGVVVLEHVIEEISRRTGMKRWPQHIHAVKFLGPLRPGDELSVELQTTGANTVRFGCRSGSRPIAVGVITLHASDFAPRQP
ncbi:MAG TPA: hypothetical protein VEZ88_09525 [Steroidobacteraceae bacterium]|nr:hypothetical protein [Steroidobacteraceae bacterium]